MAEMKPDANALYAGACQETAARIQMRETVLVAFITISSAIIGVSLKEDFRSASAIEGYIALAAALLVRHHDLIIGLLGKYQYDLCQFGKKSKEKDSAVPPLWFSEDYYPCVFKVREMRDKAQHSFILIAAIAALLLAFPPALQQHDMKVLGCHFSSRYVQWVAWIGSGFSSLCAFVVTRNSLHRRKEIAHEMLQRMSHG
ncbi:MAG TPA: hypothetical protein VGK01_26185 [Candidatus Angelobacter sp.]|jgi:hypothetical protein